MWIWQQPDLPSQQQVELQAFRYDEAALALMLRELHFLQEAWQNGRPGQSASGT